MVDISITPGSVLAGANATQQSGLAGEAITAGKVVYKDSASGKWKIADNNSATAEVRKAGGIALNNAALNQPVDVQTSGEITVGGTLVAGSDYYLSDTPGGICPRADIPPASGEFVCLLGLAKSTTVLVLDIQFPNVAV